MGIWHGEGQENFDAGMVSAGATDIDASKF
jgi:hypothetical protein